MRDTIDMAREAGFVANVSEEHWGDVPYAKLCHPTPTATALFKMLERFADLVRADERTRLEHNNTVLMNALWKACGDDEQVVNATIESQGELK